MYKVIIFPEGEGASPMGTIPFRATEHEITKLVANEQGKSGVDARSIAYFKKPEVRAKLDAIKASIKKNPKIRFQTPLLVTSHPSRSQVTVVLDGHHRLQSYKELNKEDPSKFKTMTVTSIDHSHIYLSLEKWKNDFDTMPINELKFKHMGLDYAMKYHKQEVDCFFPTPDGKYRKLR